MNILIYNEYISTKSIYEDVEKTAPISEAAISVPSTVNIKKIVKEAEQAKIEVKETKLKLQQADIIINKLIR